MHQKGATNNLLYYPSQQKQELTLSDCLVENKLIVAFLVRHWASASTGISPSKIFDYCHWYIPFNAVTNM